MSCAVSQVLCWTFQSTLGWSDSALCRNSTSDFSCNPPTSSSSAWCSIGLALLASAEAITHGHFQWVGRGEWSWEGEGFNEPLGMVMAVMEEEVEEEGGRGKLAVKV